MEQNLRQPKNQTPTPGVPHSAAQPQTPKANSQFAIHNSEPKAPCGQFTIQTLALIFLLLLYLLTAFAYAALAPLTTGPDELAHYEYVRFIAEHGRLPVNTEERAQASYKSDQPPLYHLLAALPAALVDPSGPPTLKRVSDHPRRQLIERTRHAWGLYNTEDERWPYRAEILRWHTGRWVAILFGAATVVVTFFMARDVAMMRGGDDARTRGGDDTGTRGRGDAMMRESNLAASSPHASRLTFPLAAAAIVAFIPRFGLTGAMLNYETTLAFFAALFLWVLLRMAHTTFNVQRLTFNALLLGLFAGLAIITKLSALILLPEIIIAFWLIERAAKTQNAGRKTQDARREMLIALTTTLAVISLWFGFVLYHFNTVAEDGLWVGLLRPLLAADASDATTNQLLSFLTGGEAGFTGAIENLESGPPREWARIFFRTFWMVGIENVQPLAPIGLVVALALCLLAVYGLIQVWRQSDRGPETHSASSGQAGDRGLLMTSQPPTADRRPPTAGSQPSTLNPQPPTPDPRLVLSLLTLHLSMPFILPLLRYAVTFSLADTAQGRHILFLAAPAFAILMVWGLQVAGSKVAGSRGVEEQISRTTHHALRTTHYASRFTPFLPVLLLLIWTGAHLWAMSWAYLPPLPVSTWPEAKAQATHRLNQPLNQFVNLVGYNSQLDPNGRVLRLDLIWQATALSPVDYLTEVSLMAASGEAQAQWLGYSAGGRYPTRAWDVGDIVRDTVWLPIEGLAPGPYRLALKLIPTSHIYTREADSAPFMLTDLTLPDTALRTFNSSLAFTDQAAAAAGYSVWRNGQPLTGPQEFRYRETVLVTLSPLLPNQQRTIHIVGPNNTQLFAPMRELNNTALFIVGPDWPGGDYRLQITVTSPAAGEQQVKSSAILNVIDRWERQFTLSAPPPSQGPKGGYVGVAANFADQVKLLGYELGANRAEPGGGIPLTLYWQALDWLGNDYTIFTKLLAADGTVHGGRDRLPVEGYRTIYWAPGEIVTDPFGVPVAADTPAGVYYLNIGLYQQAAQKAVSLPLVQDGQPIDATSVTIGPIKVGGPPPGATLTVANPQTELNQPFGDPPNLTLLGYDLEGGNCQQSTVNCQLSIILYWRSEATLPLDYTTFIHVLNAAGEIITQKDQLPLNGAYPTSLWDPGEIIADEITIPLPDGLPAGNYQLVVGMYDFNTGVRLIISGQPENSLTLDQTIEVRP